MPSCRVLIKDIEAKIINRKTSELKTTSIDEIKLEIASSPFGLPRNDRKCEYCGQMQPADWDWGACSYCGAPLGQRLMAPGTALMGPDAPQLVSIGKLGIGY